MPGLTVGASQYGPPLVAHAPKLTMMTGPCCACSSNRRTRAGSTAVVTVPATTKTVTADDERISAFLVGPGLGRDEQASLTGSLDFQRAAGEARACHVDRHIGAGCQAPHDVQAIWTMTV